MAAYTRQLTDGKELGEWEKSLRELVTADDKERIPKRYLGVLRVIYACLEEVYDEREEFEKDRWDARKMGNCSAPTACNFYLSFGIITLAWLKQAAKEYCRYATPLQSVGHLQGILFAVKLVAEFIGQTQPNMMPAEINRPLLVKFSAL